MRPVLNGDFIPDSPETLLDKGNFTNPESTMIGVASDDGSAATNAIPELSNGSLNISSITRKRFLQVIENWSPLFNRLSQTFKRFVKLYKEAVNQEYTPWSNINKTRHIRRMTLDLFKDSVIIAPSIYHANKFVKNGAKVFFYQVDHGIDMSEGYFTHPSFLKGYHQTEKFMVFGFPLKASHPPPADVAISKKVIEMWSNFAKTGDPYPYDTQSEESWPEYDLNSKKYLSIEPNLKVKSNLRPRQMAFWNDFIPFLNKTSYESCVTNFTKSNISDSDSLFLS
ncbi:acetylcholinesterase [Exaiptasia diaphana]|uniref:Carboxylesterase type B domain-containing protein n=1 Tax=Exaiptasia diaphana TaxID=2652724 RepID=A0A913Y5J9_EXADI|nr:acetylcholinesterase [Exaiptasia diaphana]